MSKYGVRRHGRDVSSPPHRCSCLWKDIVGIKGTFDSSIKYHVGSGQDIFFWHDLWVGDTPLSLHFPDLYRCARNQQAKVMDYMERDVDRTLWGPIFRRNLLESEEGSLMSLLDKIG